MSATKDALPALYRSLLPAALDAPAPVETKATCSACAMCSTATAVEPVDGVSRLFRPDTKCCTFEPRLPNYLVGALLADPDPELAEGRRRMEARLASRVGVTPQWLKPSAKYKLLYDNVQHAFGRSSLLRCGFFEPARGLCTIWPYREAVCSTWHCRYVAGADGREFWMTLKRYLALVEQQLSRWALYQIDPALLLDARDPALAPGAPALSAEELEDRPLSEAQHRALWLGFAGRERELYLAAHEAVRALGPDELERIVGFDGVVAVAELERKREAALTPRLPERLRFNPAATVKHLPDDTIAVAAYSDLEALALPAAAYPLLLVFTGQEPVSAVRARLRAERSVDLDDELLLSLHQHRVLVEA